MGITLCQGIIPLLIIILGSLAGAILLLYGYIWLLFSEGMVGMDLADTVIVLNKKEGIEIGRWWSESGLPDFQLVTSREESIEEDIYLYRVIEPCVYTINKDNRYTVYDFNNCTIVYQTYDLNQMDNTYQCIFEDRGRFNDIIHDYITADHKKSAMYPTFELGDGTIYIEYNSLLNEYFLKSTIVDGEVIEFMPTAEMTEGLPVDFIRKYKIDSPYICVIDCNGKRTLVNYETYECIYSEDRDKDSLPPDINQFIRGDDFIDVKDGLS